MDTKTVIEINNNIRNAKKKQLDYLKEMIDYSKKIMRECDHELVVRMRFGPKRKVLNDSYYCPACDYYLETVCDPDMTPLKNSKIIDLTCLSLDYNPELFDTIKYEIIDNFDRYNDGLDYEYIKALLMEEKPRRRVLK